MRLPEEPENFGEINIVSMVDIIFCILAFFIVSTMTLTRSLGLPVNLPSAKSGEVKQEEQINVSIKPDGDIFVDLQPVELDNLENKVSSLIKSGKETLVIINADKIVEHGKVVKVMDRLRQVPGAKLAISVQKE